MGIWILGVANPSHYAKEWVKYVAERWGVQFLEEEAGT